MEEIPSLSGLGNVRLYLNLENLLDVRQTRYDPLLLPQRAPDGRWTVDAWAPTDGFVINGGCGCLSTTNAAPPLVMAALEAAIHVEILPGGCMDGRVKPGHDIGEVEECVLTIRQTFTLYHPALDRVLDS